MITDHGIAKIGMVKIYSVAASVDDNEQLLYAVQINIHLLRGIAAFKQAAFNRTVLSP